MICFTAEEAPTKKRRTSELVGAFDSDAPSSQVVAVWGGSALFFLAITRDENDPLCQVDKDSTYNSSNRLLLRGLFGGRLFFATP